jgi:hypothetical protein
MNVFNVSRRIARKLAARIDLLERVRDEMVAVTARLLQPRGVLVPIRVVVDGQKKAYQRD